VLQDVDLDSAILRVEQSLEQTTRAGLVFTVSRYVISFGRARNAGLDRAWANR
jgi:hypothetical protein